MRALAESDLIDQLNQPLDWAAMAGDPARLATLFARLAALEQREAAGLDSEAGVEDFRVRWQARKSGYLARIRDNWLAPAPRERKKQIGLEFNRLAAAVDAELERAAGRLRSQATVGRLAAEQIDVTLPGRGVAPGATHPILRVMQEIVEIFMRLGYSVVEGPEVEDAYHNFEALNVPESHPARDDQDTFYLGPGLDNLLLRTHTSPMQIRTMEAEQPPLRIVVPGKVYRRDAPDATHSPMFHQVEGLAVDEHITLRDLKGTLDHFAREFFGSGVQSRFRPSYFPFTEPSAEMDVSCIFCAGAGCRTCKQSGWIEVLGCGMVDPVLFDFVRYNARRWSGFAFGMGVERMAMIRYDVDDIQRFYSGDIRFLEQFRK